MNRQGPIWRGKGEGLGGLARVMCAVFERRFLRRGVLQLGFKRCITMKRIPYSQTILVVLLSVGVGPTLTAADYVRLERVGTLTALSNEEMATDLEVSGDYAYLTWRGNGNPNGGIVVLDISDPNAPRMIASVPLGVFVTDTSLYSDRLYASWIHWTNFPDGSYLRRSGIDVIDIGNPSQPKTLGRFEDSTVLLEEMAKIYVLGQHALVLPATTNMWVLDISDPTNIHKVVSLPEELQVLALNGRYAYGCWQVTPYKGDGSTVGQVVVIDVADPTAPTVISRTSLPFAAPVGWANLRTTCACVSNGVAYFGWQTEYEGGFLAVDVFDPFKPIILHEYVTLHGWARNINIAGRFAYVRAGPFIEVYDVSNPRSVTLVGGCNLDVFTTSWSARGADVRGDYLFAADEGPLRLSVYTITELPAITRQTITGNMLNLQWNDPAKGMTLQRATSLPNPDWQDLLGSETTNAVSLPIWGGPEFFRLMKR